MRIFMFLIFVSSCFYFVEGEEYKTEINSWPKPYSNLEKEAKPEEMRDTAGEEKKAKATKKHIKKKRAHQKRGNKPKQSVDGQEEILFAEEITPSKDDFAEELRALEIPAPTGSRGGGETLGPV